MFRRRLVHLRWLSVGGVALHFGCATQNVMLPAGHLPPPAQALDVQTAVALSSAPAPARIGPVPKVDPAAVADPKKDVFQIPKTLPGGGLPFFTKPEFDRNLPAAEKERLVREAYPVLVPVAATVPAGDRAALGLAELEQLASDNSPAIKKAEADAAISYGQVIQAGLYPNPTAGYQADQVQPHLRIPPGATYSGAGQHGGFINQLIKTAGKLTFTQQVSGFDYINALVAVRGARVTVTARVRTAYFAALVAQQNASINKDLADMLDLFYNLQLKRVVFVDAGYEPLQTYAQAVQVRNAYAQAQATSRAAWKQLAAAIGQPDLPQAELSGRADAPAPIIDPEAAKARILEQHTDLLTARNSLAQSQTNLILQKRLPIPDIGTNQYHQYDNAAQTYQFGVQVGISLPIYDRNQGNIRSAQSKIISNGLQLEATRNDLFARFAEAYGRYQANTIAVSNYRDKVLPSLTQVYLAIIRRYQVDPDKIGFSDIVVAQQNLAQAMQTYLTVLDGQWKAVVDAANISQVDELYPAK